MAVRNNLRPEQQEELRKRMEENAVKTMERLKARQEKMDILAAITPKERKAHWEQGKADKRAEWEQKKEEQRRQREQKKAAKRRLWEQKKAEQHAKKLQRRQEKQDMRENARKNRHQGRRGSPWTT